jgi:hypothetical protein
VDTRTPAEPWGWIEVFVAVQLLWGALLFIPGMQALRLVVRVLPYATSLAALGYFVLRRAGRDRLPPSAPWLIGVFALLGLNLLHDSSHLMAGVGQGMLQVAIAAPAFWAGSVVHSRARFDRVLWLVFLASLLSAGLGVLQTYYPERFLPPEFSSLAQAMNPNIVESLTYEGADGQSIIRPPGLSDLPGGAAVAGMMAVVLGVALASHPTTAFVWRLATLGAAAVGMTALYLTQVRSLSVLAVASVLLMAAVRVRQGKVALGGWIVAGGVALVAASFVWATAVGGSAVYDRFASLFGDGVINTYQESRGSFLKYTVVELLEQYPLGAGLGRWGMMQVYLGDPTHWDAPPIYVELQITGWLLDGGVLMWVLYGGALLAAVRYAYLVSVHGLDDTLRSMATVVLSFLVAIVGMCFSGPVFNTQLGIVFWTLAASLFGVVDATWRERSGGRPS